MQILFDNRVEDNEKGGVSKSTINYRLEKEGRKSVHTQSLLKHLDELKELGLVSPQSPQKHTKDVSRKYKLSPKGIMVLLMFGVRPRMFEGVAESQRGRSASGLSDYDYTVSVPSSILLAGDHVRRGGDPAVVLPVPLYVHAALSIEPSSDNSPEELSLEFCYTNPYKQYEMLSQKLIYTPAKKSPYAKQARKLEKEFRKKASERGIPIMRGRIAVHVEPPLGCGLEGSSAISAAFALLLHLCAGKEPSLSNWRGRSAAELNHDEDFRRILNDAWEFEKIIAKGDELKASATGVLASLQGSEGYSPILCGCGKSRDGGIEVKVYDRLPPNVRSRWCKEIGVAAVYSGYQRQEDYAKLSYPEGYQQRLPQSDRRSGDLNDVTQTLWDNLRRAEWDDVITSMSVYSAMVHGLFKSKFNADVRLTDQLINYYHALGIGAKYSGEGFGGDLVVIGSLDDLSKFLIPNYYPIHAYKFSVEEKQAPDVVPRVRRVKTA
ncbi:MAG: hypothetical protein ABSB53_04670 [Nitrososphaerales archaeon]